MCPPCSSDNAVMIWNGSVKLFNEDGLCSGTGTATAFVQLLQILREQRPYHISVMERSAHKCVLHEVFANILGFVVHV